MLRDIPCDLLGWASDPEHPRLGSVSQIQDKHLTHARPDIKFKERITEAGKFVEQIESVLLVTTTSVNERVCQCWKAKVKSPESYNIL